MDFNNLDVNVLDLWDFLDDFGLGEMSEDISDLNVWLYLFNVNVKFFILNVNVFVFVFLFFKIVVFNGKDLFFCLMFVL